MRSPVRAHARKRGATMARQRTFFVDTSGNVVPRTRRRWALPQMGRFSKTARKRLAVLLAAITVPAMAATGGVGELPGPAVESSAALATRQAAEAALPFERPGMSFPGSAYFYMADPAGTALVALPTDDPLATGAESGRALGALIDVGAAAKPFYMPGTGISHLRASECLAQAVWYEAASESEAGQRAVAQVVLNRVAHPSWPNSVCGVVYQGSERSTGCQFTFTCDGSLARRPSGMSWARAQRIADEALAGSVYAPVGLATHYHIEPRPYRHHRRAPLLPQPRGERIGGGVPGRLCRVRAGGERAHHTPAAGRGAGRARRADHRSGARAAGDRHRQRPRGCAQAGCCHSKRPHRAKRTGHRDRIGQARICPRRAVEGPARHRKTACAIRREDMVKPPETLLSHQALAPHG